MGKEKIHVNLSAVGVNVRAIGFNLSYLEGLPCGPILMLWQSS